MKHLFAHVVVGITFALAPIAAVQAALTFLSVPGISGEEATPGYPNAMAAEAVGIVPQGFSIIKKIDSASPGISSAVLGGSMLGTSSLLFYNAAPAGTPDAILQFHNSIATGQGGGAPREADIFASTNAGSLFLEIPGIVGESSTPGHTGVIQLQEFSLKGSEFTIQKAIDSASPSIAFAVAAGTHFPTASLLLYDAAVPAGPPDDLLVFHNLFATASLTLGVNNVFFDRDTFSFATISQPVPEPAAAGLLAMGATLLASRRFRRSELTPLC
jgi:type VI protein secretion system component Hcp